MADDDTLDTNDEKGGKSGGKLKMILMIVGGIVLISSLSIFGTWFMLKDKIAEPGMPDMSELPMDEPTMTPSQGAAIYHAMQPAFIVNYTSGGRSRFLQVELSVLTRDPAAIEVLILHNPLIRNNLLDVFSAQDVMTLSTADGKQKLADELTKAIQDVLIIEMGRPGIESVLFRSFIMQ
ncbi:MAG: flagellar basal body-associated FliL family protein [Reinekea sp.]|nr:flagellar basal body-associated FliL family protein [Reinekea sp.]